MAEACYVDRTLPASFKGVAFDAIDASSDHGRRGAEGEFPFGETTAYADLGRRIRTYSLRARYAQNDHIVRAALLIAACELKGPGILVHPTRGVILSAACKSLKVNDKLEEEGGVTYVDMDFVEANNWPNGLSIVGQLLGILLGSIIGASRTHFTSTYAPRTIQPFRQDAVLDAAQNQIVNITNEYSRATSATPTDLARSRIISDLTRLSNSNEMASSVEIMDRGIALGMNAIALATVGRAKYDTFRRLANGAALSSTFAAPASTVENSIYSNVRIIAASYMVQAALEEPESRTGDVFEQMDIIDAILRQEQDYARQICDNPLFLEISRFRNEATTKLYEKAYTSPGLTSYNFSGRVHPLTAAYAIYGDAKQHRAIENFNLIGSQGRVGPSVLAAIR